MGYIVSIYDDNNRKIGKMGSFVKTFTTITTLIIH